MRRETWLPAVALASGLVLGAGAVAFTADTQPGGTYGQPGGAYGRGGKHPHIAAANRALTHAEGQLERAAHHYGGHRAKALELVKQAESELRQALVYADAHPDEFKQGAAAPGAPAHK
ncbi:MAG: hypothetical protein AUH30_19600 [Candidatus Rokubacteria bacterium 13_1_40CM_68_15]|nr:MAG: hypothetical protein AUH30_19600 [Candidatus Rokubacteria bacterium 13_1_40CM_68_15]